MLYNFWKSLYIRNECIRILTFVALKVTSGRHRSLSQHGLTKAILGESVFAIDLASISYIGSEESPDSHGSSPPYNEKTLKLCGFKVFLLPKNRHSTALEFCANFEAFSNYCVVNHYDKIEKTI